MQDYYVLGKHSAQYAQIRDGGYKPIASGREGPCLTSREAEPRQGNFSLYFRSLSWFYLQGVRSKTPVVDICPFLKQLNTFGLVESKN